MTTTKNTAAAIAAEIIATAETRIELRAAELHDVECFRELCASAVAWLDAEYFGQADDDDDEEHADEYRDPLSFDVYLNGRTGEYIAELDLAVGGPTIRARYESRWGVLTITAAWGLGLRGDERPKLRLRRLDRNLRRLLLLKAPRPAAPVGCI